jgi:hypothetical protein
MTSKVMTSAEEADGPTNLKKYFLYFFIKKRTDLRLIYVENVKYLENESHKFLMKYFKEKLSSE